MNFLEVFFYYILPVALVVALAFLLALGANILRSKATSLRLKEVEFRQLAPGFWVIVRASLFGVDVEEKDLRSTVLTAAPQPITRAEYQPPADPAIHDFAVYLLSESKRIRPEGDRKLLGINKFPTDDSQKWRRATDYLRQWGVITNPDNTFQGTEIGPYYDSIARLHTDVIMRRLPLPRTDGDGSMRT